MVPNQAFPVDNVLTSSSVPPEMYSASPTAWLNYQSAEDAQDTVQELLDRMLERDWAKQYPSVEDLLHHHGQGCEMAPLNKLGLISKLRADGTLKHR
eukprot:1777123-Amphidinium_carterae.3